jgi:hypothetical protein
MTARDLPELIAQWRHNAQGCGRLDRQAADTWRSCARQLESALAGAGVVAPAPVAVGVDEALSKLADHAEWFRNDGRTHLAIRVADGADLSCKANRLAALIAALEADR